MKKNKLGVDAFKRTIADRSPSNAEIAKTTLSHYVKSGAWALDAVVGMLATFITLIVAVTFGWEIPGTFLAMATVVVILLNALTTLLKSFLTVKYLIKGMNQLLDAPNVAILRRQRGGGKGPVGHA